MKTELNEKQIKTLEKLIKKVINDKVENKVAINEGKVEKSLTEKKLETIETLIKKVLNEEMISKGITTEGLGDYLHGALKGVKDVVKSDVKSVKDNVGKFTNNVGKFTNKVGDKINAVKDGAKSRVNQIKMAGETANQDAKQAKKQLEADTRLREILTKVNEFNMNFLPKLVVKKAKLDVG